MTADEYDQLTSEQKQIKVAELDGWIIAVKAEVGLDGRFPWLHPKGNPESPERYYLAYGTHNLPEYLNDLNACQVFEDNSLSFEEAAEYDEYLDKLIGASYKWSATAEQKCKAFVLTKTK